MFDRSLPEFPFEIEWDGWDNSPMYCLTDVPYTRTAIYTGDGSRMVEGMNGFDNLHRDEVYFMSRGVVGEQLNLGAIVSVEFIYLLGRGI